MSNRLERGIYNKSGISHFWRGRYFPKGVRDDVFKLYSFLHTASIYAHKTLPNVERFEYIEHRWDTIKKDLSKKIVPAPLDDSVDERVLANIAYIVHRHSCDPSWVDAYLQSMRFDMQKHTYRGLKATLEYMHGASEVPALVLVRILNLPEEVLKPARMQGRALHYLSLLHNIVADTTAGRNYFPVTEIKKYGLKDLSKEEALAKPAMFTEFIHAQLIHYANWQTEANACLLYVPKCYKHELQLIIDMYAHLAEQIKNDPLIVFKQNLELHKPTFTRRVIRRGKG